MSELPRTEDLPRTQDGYDAARVEEAFAAFAARVHDLEEVASELRDELRALRTSRSVRDDDEDWPDAYANGAPAPPPDWIDLALAVPVLDAARARAELGWQPRWTAPDAVREWFAAVHDAAGLPTPPLAPGHELDELTTGVGGRENL